MAARVAAALALARAATAAGGEADVPKGHLEPFGGWREGTPIEERDDVPVPKEFYDRYCNADGGSGKPLLMRGAAKDMAAMSWGDDDRLLERFGKLKIQGVEWQLKETRAGGQVEGMRTLSDFLGRYNTSDIYMVSKVPKRMGRDVQLLPCLRCGDFLSFLDVANMWMGRGGSASVIHYDDQDNINCMLAGSKRFAFMHPSYKTAFEAHPNSERNRFGWVDTDLDRSIPGYGAFMGRVDVSSMDLVKYPAWRQVEWSYANLDPGDCVYIPYQWYHTVQAAPVRSINVHVWYWRPKHFDAWSCERHGEATAPSLADCSWGYEPQGGHLGEKTGKTTRCRRAKPAADRGKSAEL